MLSDASTLNPDEPLSLPDPPTNTSNDDLHALVKTIERSVDGDIKWGADTYKFALYIVYMATTSETEYTLSDLTEILDNDAKYHNFCADEGGDQFPDTVGSPPTVTTDSTRTFLVDQLNTIDGA